MTKVSIIVPVYNSGLYLKNCIDSLVNQSLNDIEIIIINDGSIDNSEDIIKQYNDSRIVYVSKKNEGIAKTRNKGINLCRGEYIAFVDSDDCIDKAFCEKMYDNAIKNNSDIVICDYYNCSNNKTNKVTLLSFRNAKLKNNSKIINGINLGPCNKIFSKFLIKEQNILFPEYLKYEDVAFVCECLVKAKNISKLDEALSIFNLHEGSQTTIRDEKIFDIFKVMDKVKNILNNIVSKKDINFLIISTILNYLAQSRYIKNNKLRKTFIQGSYQYLNSNFQLWKKNEYLKSISIIRRTILRKPFLLKVYSFVYVKLFI